MSSVGPILQSVVRASAPDETVFWSGAGISVDAPTCGPLGATLVDRAWVGATKKAGTIYERIRDYLRTKGIPSAAAAIIGDDPQLDVEHAQPYGFFTVQYVGVLDRGGSEKADFAMRDWKDIGAIL